MRVRQDKFHREADTSGISMRTRLLLYWFSMALAVVAAVLAILSAAGVLSHSARQFGESLTIQQQNAAAALDSQMDELTAQGVALSEKLGKELDAFLAGAGMAFSELNDDPDAITALEQRLYAPLSSTLSAAACSGVFCCLDVTANTGLEEASSSRAGLYLRYSGLQPTTASEQNLVCFRGMAEAARRLQLQLHNRWNPELNLSLIPGSEAVMASRDGRLAERCLWTERVALSDTWEKVVLLCVPLLDGSGTVRGFCGLEVSDLYFSLSHAAVSSPYGSMVTLLAPVEGNSLSLAGALLGGTDGSRLTAEGTLYIKEGKYYTTYSDDRETYLGTHQLLDAATSDGVPLAAVTLVPDSAFRQQERSADSVDRGRGDVFAGDAGVGGGTVSPLRQTHQQKSCSGKGRYGRCRILRYPGDRRDAGAAAPAYDGRAAPQYRGAAAQLCGKSGYSDRDGALHPAILHRRLHHQGHSGAVLYQRKYGENP